MKVNVVTNENVMMAGGAGIQAAQMVVKTGASMVVTGNIGPNAFQTLQAADIKVISGAYGRIQDVVDKVINGKLKEDQQANVPSHFGLNN
jgi:predicted Fe-Mo cluster-binding NifX family protein